MSKYLKSLFSLKRLQLLVVYASIFLLSGFVGNIWMTRNQQTGQIPDISAINLQGQPVNLGVNHLKENPLLIYFFADWCPICKAQHSVISAIDEDYDVLGIAMQSGDIDNVGKYVADQNIGFSVINDENGNISRSFGVNGVPAAFIVDKTGDLKYSTRGYATEAGLRSRLWLADSH